MRRDVLILGATIVVGAAVTWGPMVPEAMSDMQTFRVSDVRVAGARFLSEDSVRARLGLTPESSIWDDPKPWAERLSAHPLVRSAKVRRRFPNGLRVTVEERQPVALAATPTLEPVDADGYRLPIDPTRYPLDLPIVTAGSVPPKGSALFGEDVRSLVAEIVHLGMSDADFLLRVSTLRHDGRGAFVARLTGPDIDFLLPSRVAAGRLRAGEAALSDAMSRSPGSTPRSVDLRFADQVVVRRFDSSRTAGR